MTTPRQQIQSTTEYSPVLGEAQVNPYVKQGVVDKSDAMQIQAQTGLIGEISRIGMDAWKGYEKAKLENETESVIDEYMKRNHPEQTPAVSPAEQAHIDGISQIKNAYDQGLMSEAEFETRIRSVTKDAVNRTPGFYPELLDHSKKVLGLSGINDIVKQDQVILKAQKEQKSAYLKNVIDAAEKNNIPLDYQKIYSDDNYAVTINKAVSEVVGRKQLSDTLESTLSQEKARDNIEIEKFINSDLLPQAALGTVEKYTTDVASLFSSANTPQDFSGALNVARNRGEAIKRQYMAFAGNYINDPRVKSQIDFISSQIDETIKNISTFKSGEEVAKYVANQKQIFMDNDAMSFYKTSGVSPAAASFLNNFLSTQVAANLANQGKLPLIMKAVDYLEKGINNVSQEKNAQGKPLVLDLFSQALANPTQDTSIKVLENATGAIREELADTTKFTPQKRYEFETDYVKTLAKGGVEDSFKGLSDKSRMDAMAVIDGYEATTVAFMDKAFSKYAQEGKKITLDVLPDGRLNVVADVPSKEIAKFTSRINDGIKAYANLMGIDTKQAAEQFFYPKFFKVAGEQSKPASTQTTQKPKEEGSSISRWLGADNGQLDDSLVSDIKRYMRESVGEQAVPIDEARQEEILGEFRNMGNRIRERIKVEKIAAQEHLKNKKQYENKEITYEQYLERSSSLNNALKANLQELK